MLVYEALLYRSETAMRTKYTVPKSPQTTAEKSKYAEFDAYTTTAVALALAEHGYAGLMKEYKDRATAGSSRNVCPGCEESSTGKDTSNAHSCVSRKTLEMAFRYGLCEFYAAASMPLRDRDTVLKDSLDLHGEKTGARSTSVVPSSITKSLNRLDLRFADALAPLPLQKQAALSRRLADTLQQDLHTVLTADLPDEYSKAFVGALCTAYRRLVLRIVAAHAPRQPDKFLRMLMQVVAVGKDSPLATFDMAGAFAPLVGNSNDSSGLAVNWIHANALNWATEGKVEFGKQCVDCENAQGDEDLSRRLLDYMVEEGLPPNAPIPAQKRYGKLFADLYPSTDNSRSTVWDLSNAVTCTAVEVFYTLARATHRAAQPSLQKEFAEGLLSHLEALPHLFVAYMEILVLELAHTEPFLDKDNRHRLVKMLVTPDAPLPVELPKKPVEVEEPVVFDLFS